MLLDTIKSQQRTYEGFRLDATRWKEQYERLRLANQSATRMINCLLACRLGPTAELIEIRDALKEAGRPAA